MPKKRRVSAKSKESNGSLAKSLNLLRSEVKIGNQELQAGLSQLRDEMRAGFDQIYKHVDGFTKLHETLDIR